MSQEDNGEALTLRKKGNTKTRVQITQTGIVEEKVTVRSHTRQILLEHVAKGTTIIQRIQAKRTTWLDWFFVSSSFLGDTVLYSSLFPFLFWVYNPHLGRLSLFLLIVGTIVGNILKNSFALPRPPSPPLWCPKQLNDFGLPSIHSLNAVAMPWFFLYFTWDTYTSQTTKILLVIAFALYSLSMFVSRMYLAAHSHVDVISGIIIGIPVLTIWINVHTYVNQFLIGNPYSFQIMAVISVLVILFHPRSSRPSPSWSYTIALLGIALGATLGISHSVNYGTVLLDPYQQTLCGDSLYKQVTSSFSGEFTQYVVASLFKVIVGLVMMVATYGIVKVIVFFVIGFVLELGGISTLVEFAKTNIIKLALPHPTAYDNLDFPQFGKKEYPTTKQEAKIVSNFCATFMVGWVVTHFIPLLFICSSFLPANHLSK